MTLANDPLGTLRFLEPETQKTIPESIFVLRAVRLGARSHLIWRRMTVWVATKLDLTGKCPEDLVCVFTKHFLRKAPKKRQRDIQVSRFMHLKARELLGNS